ncbi:MAG: O-antigen ligase family protein [Planctomycetes bacterium]|nr:O-antigen ligase family protein [Planctomycetota bacterium]
MGIVIAIVVLIGLPFFFRRYRLEGLVAAYAHGLPVFYLISDYIKLPLSREVTGAFLAVTGGISLMAFLFYRPQDASEGPQSRFTLAFGLLFVLALSWFIFHIFERFLTSIIMERVEFFKWAYSLTNWFLALGLGYFFCLNGLRVQRVLRAIAVLGIVMCTITLVFFFTGRGDLTLSYGMRFHATEHLGGGSYSIHAAMAAGGLLGGYLVAQHRLSARRIVFVIAAMMLFVSTSILGGSRSPIVVMVLVVFFALGTFRFRYIPIALCSMVVALLIVVFVVAPLLPEGGFKRAMTFESMVDGVATRLWLVHESLNILNVSPVWGRTIGLEQVIGMAYSHNFTLQMLVETGLVGFGLYLSATTIVAIYWFKMLVGYQRAYFAIGAPLLIYFLAVWLEAHAHGDIMNRSLWFCLGAMAAHPPVQRFSSDDEQLDKDMLCQGQLQ